MALDAHELADLSGVRNQPTCGTVAFIKIRESPTPRGHRVLLTPARVSYGGPRTIPRFRLDRQPPRIPLIEGKVRNHRNTNPNRDHIRGVLRRPTHDLSPPTIVRDLGDGPISRRPAGDLHITRRSGIETVCGRPIPGGSGFN